MQARFEQTDKEPGRLDNVICDRVIPREPSPVVIQCQHSGANWLSKLCSELYSELHSNKNDYRKGRLFMRSIVMTPYLATLVVIYFYARCQRKERDHANA